MPSSIGIESCSLGFIDLMPMHVGLLLDESIITRFVCILHPSIQPDASDNSSASVTPPCLTGVGQAMYVAWHKQLHAADHVQEVWATPTNISRSSLSTADHPLRLLMWETNLFAKTVFPLDFKICRDRSNRGGRERNSERTDRNCGLPITTCMLV